MRKRNQGHRSHGDSGGVTFIEVMVTFAMVAIAVVVTTYSLFFGHRTLRVDMHKQQIARIVQERLEYWTGRWYISFPEPGQAEREGGLDSTYILDPDTEHPIEVNVYRETVVDYFNPAYALPTGPPIPSYRILTVYAEWTEFDGEAFRRNVAGAKPPISLTTYVTHP